ncbi:MAG TPA: hypothetical protein VEV20_11945 [Burkholderiales bacterium]|nr:hypothetical protein [Burkholderiales bacterium]
MRLSHGHRRWVYWSGAALFATGTLWLVFHYFLRQHGEFGETPHSLEVWWLRLHGACAMLVLIVAGSLLPIHVRRGWHQRKNLLAGSVIVAILVLLTASGYALYYYGGEEARPLISAFHWIVGLGAPLTLIWHISRARHAHTRSDQPARRPVIAQTGQQQKSTTTHSGQAAGQPQPQPTRPSVSA